MATTRTGQPTSQGQETMGFDQGPQQEARDRRAAGDTGGIVQTLRSTTYRKLDDQKARASDALGSVAGAIRGMTDPLRDSGQAGMADYVHKAADGVERWASQLRQGQVDDAVRAVQNFARRQPALFLGIAFGAGVLAARFLKSSAEESGYRNADQSGGSGNMGRRGISSSAFGTPQRDSTGTSQPGTTGETPRISSDMPSAREVL